MARKPATDAEATSTILTVMDGIFGSFFRPTASWLAWRAFLAALFGLPLDASALALYRKHTGRRKAPAKPAMEGWLVVGRRGGKSRISALVAVFFACFKDYSAYLAPGERATVMVIAADRKQARVVLRYITGMLESVPMLAAMVESQTREAIHLSNRVTIEVHTASFRTTRGYTIPVVIVDEIAFLRSEDSANPDTEILNALRPAMATIPGSVMLAISSPYARRGALWEAYRAHYGKDGDPVLVWQADTRAMNPSVPERVIQEAYERDEASAAAEYGAQFRRDVESFVPREIVDAVTVEGRRELPPVAGTRYLAFVDPSGGSSDSMTLAIAHVETRAATGLTRVVNAIRGSSQSVAVLDAIREVKPPFSPEAVTSEFAALLKTYGITKVTGDRYGGEWPRERFRTHGVSYEPADRTKSDFYRDLLPLLNGQRVELLDDRKLGAQLCGLERRTARGGKDSVDHGPNAHDDVINAAAGALVLAASGSGTLQVYLFDVSGPEVRLIEPGAQPATPEPKPSPITRAMELVKRLLAGEAPSPEDLGVECTRCHHREREHEDSDRRPCARCECAWLSTEERDRLSVEQRCEFGWDQPRPPKPAPQPRELSDADKAFLAGEHGGYDEINALHGSGSLMDRLFR